MFIFCILLLSILLFKDPTSANNIIPDLEPFPDSLHYLNPLISLSEGKGLNLSYQNQIIPPSVPPLYSLTIFPLYLIFRDVRSFYITNVLLTLASTFLFYKILTKLFSNKTILNILLFAFVTNFVIFWYPSFAMAENLLILLYLLSIWLLLQPLNLVSLFLISLLVVAFFATKYVAWVISLSLAIVFTIKIISAKISQPKKFLFSATFLASLIFFSTVLVYFSSLNKVNITAIIAENLARFVAVLFEQNKAVQPFLDYYSKSYFENNFIRLLAGTLGGLVTVAGKDMIILQPLVGMTSIFAIFVNLFISKYYKLLNVYFLISITGTLLFISTFYVVDARYLFEFISAFLLIFGFFLNFLYDFLIKFKRKIYANLILFFVILCLAFNALPMVINQIKINFFQGERATNFETVNVINSYTNQFDKPSNIIVISVLPQLFIDFYSNKKFAPLPLSPSQHFSNYSKDELFKTYTDALLKGDIVLLSAYRTDESYFFNLNLQQVKEKFNLTLVAWGCGDLCNLYRLELKQI